MLKTSAQRGAGARRIVAEQRLRVPADTNLLDPQFHGDKIYLLHSGQVQLSRQGEAILGYVGAGHFLGERVLLGEKNGVEVARALTPVEMTVFNRSSLLDRIQDDRRFAERLLKDLVRRIDAYEEIIREMVTEKVELRLAHVLNRLAPPSPATGWVEIPFNPTNPELARMVGTTRWRISHFLNRFQRLGWLRRRNGLFVRREGLHQFLRHAGQAA